MQFKTYMYHSSISLSISKVNHCLECSLYISYPCFHDFTTCRHYTRINNVKLNVCYISLFSLLFHSWRMPFYSIILLVGFKCIHVYTCKPTVNSFKMDIAFLFMNYVTIHLLVFLLMAIWGSFPKVFINIKLWTSLYLAPCGHRKDLQANA